mgnify:CR=1 FL=1
MPSGRSALRFYDFWCGPCAGPLPHNTGGAAGRRCHGGAHLHRAAAAPRRYGSDRRLGLGWAGFVYQTVFRNPLASPDIIGVSSGASVGAAFAILFVSSGALATTVCAFAGGLAAVFLSLGLAAAAPGRSKMSLVLAGIAVHALAQTLLMLLKLTADPEKELASIEYWIMGSLAAVTRSRVWFPVLVVLVCCAAIFALHRQALLLSIEEGEARLLGVRVVAMRLLLLTLATMTVAAVVSVTGLISFVGLLAPHSARLLAGTTGARPAC